MFALRKFSKSPYIIGEIGVNHNGSIKIAFDLIKKAKESGFDAVKFQTFIPEEMTHEKNKLAKYQARYDFTDMRSMLENYKLSFNDFSKIKNYCDNIKIDFLSTPFDLKSAIFLNKIKLKAFKISSGDLNNFLLLEKIKSFNKPIIISTGMARQIEIIKTVNFLNKKNKDLAILHCVSDYPTEIKNTYLSNINILKNFGYDVGFSDHTMDFIASSASLCLGAVIIEKHITLNKKMKGPDHFFSLEANEFNNFIENLRSIYSSINSPRVLTADEKKNKLLVRKSIYYSQFLNKGHKIIKEDLIALRPALNGISPVHFYRFIGKKLKRNIKKKTLVKFKDF